MENKTIHSFAGFLQHHRHALGLSTYRFAKGCGCSEATIRHLEHGRYHPTLGTCILVADFLKLPRTQVAQLAGYTIESQKELSDRSRFSLGTLLEEALRTDPEFWAELIETASQLGPKGKKSVMTFARFVLREEAEGIYPGKSAMP